MTTIKKVLLTLVLIPISIVLGIIFGIVLLLSAPFSIFEQLFNSIWGYEDERTEDTNIG